MSEPTQEPGDVKAEPTGDIPVEVVTDAAPAADAGGAAEGSAGAAAPPPDATAAAELAALTAKLAVAEKDKKDSYDRYLRAAADLENLRKRQKRELDDAKLESKFKVLKEMLPVVDNLERAVEHAGGGGEPDAALKPILEGVQLVLRQFQTAFERLDIQAVEAAGQPFDPNLHEAISQVESDQPAGTVVTVLQRGYKSGDRLLRPTLVVVAKAKAAAE